jgi:hypothetical protein
MCAVLSVLLLLSHHSDSPGLARSRFRTILFGAARRVVSRTPDWQWCFPRDGIAGITACVSPYLGH